MSNYEWTGHAALKTSVFFIFIFFENIFYRNIFSISQFTVLYPCRPAGGWQGACRPAAERQELICKFKKKLFARKPLAGACRPPAGRQAPCRQSTGRQGAGGRQAPPSCIKGFPSPSPLICFPRHPESGRERGGVRADKFR